MSQSALINDFKERKVCKENLNGSNLRGYHDQLRSHLRSNSKFDENFRTKPKDYA